MNDSDQELAEAFCAVVARHYDSACWKMKAGYSTSSRVHLNGTIHGCVLCHAARQTQWMQTKSEIDRCRAIYGSRWRRRVRKSIATLMRERFRGA